VIDVVLELEVDQVEVSSHSLVEQLAFGRQGEGSHSPGVFPEITEILIKIFTTSDIFDFTLSTCVELNTRLALSPSKNIQKLFKLVVQINLWEFVKGFILLPKWEGLNYVININGLIFPGQPQLLEQIVGFVVLHVLFKLMVSEVSFNVHL
jgi:hypothetical protein